MKSSSGTTPTSTIIKSTAARLDIGYVDDAEDFAGNPDYFLDFVHYSRAGVERLAWNYENAIFSRITAEPG